SPYGSREAALASEFIDLGEVCSDSFCLFISGIVSMAFLLLEFRGSIAVFKLARGKTRLKVFFSATIVCCGAAALLRVSDYFAYFLIGHAFCPEEMEYFLSFSDFLPFGALVSVLGTVAFNCAVTAVGMCVFRRHAFPVIAGFLIAATLLFYVAVPANTIRVRLEEPELTEVYTGDRNGMPMPIFSDSDFETAENPEYVGGVKRAFLTAVFDCFSWTQDYQFSYYENADPPRRWTFPLYSAAWILIFSLSGAAVFRRRDLL
ncbi:MAG: hypothetical protein IJL26_04015, partial [Clostridia bacterium]|nr:hypothetical protein [Clostridia bacterium]